MGKGIKRNIRKFWEIKKGKVKKKKLVGDFSDLPPFPHPEKG